MKHYGDITKLSGYTLPVVDVITGGSPCQDLSVAGLRKGLQHADLGNEETTRSGLFMDQIRIVKEMRERDRATGRADNNIRPRYMVWENVPGAFSSNGGADFQAVLTEIVRIAEPDAPDVPMPARGGWSKSGCIYGEMGNWSIAWRVHDAQFWGVPQRRKRIALVADFGGMSAPEICFERKGLSGNPQSRRAERKEATGSSGEGSEEAGGVAMTFQERAGKPGGGKGILIQSERTGALSTLNNQSVFCLHGGGETSQSSRGNGYNEDASYTLNTVDRHGVAYGFDGGQGAKAATVGYEEEKAGTLKAGRELNVLCLNDQGGAVMGVSEEVTGTLRAQSKGHEPIVFNGENITSSENKANPQPSDPCHTQDTDSRNYVLEPTMIEMTSTKNTIVESGISPTLTARMGSGGNQVNAICMDVVFFQSYEEQSSTLLARQYKDPPITYQEKCGALMASGYEKNGTQEAANDMYVVGSVVRKLTPLECERLQGFPDGWTDIGEWTDSKGKVHKPSDGPRYKALGNSIAIPFWFYLLRRIAAQYECPATLGSLFDGIGGFPLCWERCNGPGTAVWASEIEEFPIAVTKLRFPEE